MHHAFSAVTAETVLPYDIRMNWDVEAFPTPTWHVFHSLMTVVDEGKEYRYFATNLINCSERLRIQLREVFIEGSDVVHARGIDEEEWSETLTGMEDARSGLRQAFSRWAFDGGMVCSFVT